MFEAIDAGHLSACVLNRWTPTIGDPTISGWVTVAAYLACSGLAFAVLSCGRAAPRAFWQVLAIIMLLLAVNKQLDLQSALTATGRCIATAQGWYEDRRAFQHQFIIGLIVAIACVLIVGLYLLRRHLRRNGLALLGLALVGGFVAVRAVGFHHFDALIRQELYDVRLNVLMENAGLVLIAINSLALLLSRRPPMTGGQHSMVSAAHARRSDDR